MLTWLRAVWKIGPMSSPLAAQKKKSPSPFSCPRVVSVMHPFEVDIGTSVPPAADASTSVTPWSPAVSSTVMFPVWVAVDV